MTPDCVSAARMEAALRQILYRADYASPGFSEGGATGFTHDHDTLADICRDALAGDTKAESGPMGSHGQQGTGVPTPPATDPDRRRGDALTGEPQPPAFGLSDFGDSEPPSGRGAVRGCEVPKATSSRKAPVRDESPKAVGFGFSLPRGYWTFPSGEEVAAVELALNPADREGYMLTDTARAMVAEAMDASECYLMDEHGEAHTALAHLVIKALYVAGRQGWDLAAKVRHLHEIARENLAPRKT